MRSKRAKTKYSWKKKGNPSKHKVQLRDTRKHISITQINIAVRRHKETHDETKVQSGNPSRHTSEVRIHKENIEMQSTVKNGETEYSY